MDYRKLKYEPRKWQKQALNKWKEKFEGVVSVATAGGKTFFAFMCINEFLIKNPNGKIIIMVPTIPLLDQWKIAAIEELGVNENDISLGGGGHKFLSLKSLNIFVYKTGAKIIPSLNFNDSEFMLIVDECHKAGTETIRVIFEDNCKYQATLGLSATPQREYDSFFEDYVEPTLGKIIFTYSYEEALSEGVIPDFELKNIKIWSNDKEKQEIKSLKQKIAKKISIISSSQGISKSSALNSPIVQNMLYKLSRQNKNLESRRIMTVKLIINSKYNKAIIFHESILEVERINYLLQKRGINSTSYHSKLTGNARYANLSQFKVGIYRVLVTCEALDEGLNVPSLDFAIIAAGNLSKRQRIQRLGRTLRTTKGKEKATICTLYYSDQELERLKNESIKLKDSNNIQWLKSSPN